MTTKTKIYAVDNRDGVRRLVRAKSKPSAIGFVARNDYTVALASQEDIVNFMVKSPDAVVEDATKAEAE